MSESNRVESHFRGGAETPELEDYRPISMLVIVACIAGLVSLLASLHPILWFLPIVAVVLSVCAILQVSAPQSRYSGRGAAAISLCLAALIGTYAPARSISRDRALYASAQAKAEEFISLVQQGRFQEAHQFTLEPSARFNGPGSLTDHYVPVPRTGQPDPDTMDSSDMMMGPNASEELAAFMQNAVTVKLVEFGKQASITHLQNGSVGLKPHNSEMTQLFRASGIHDGQPESFEFLVTSTRWEGLGHANWQVGDFKKVE